MFGFLLGLARVELRVTAQRALTTVLLFAVGLVLLLIAVGGALFAAFLALAEHNSPVVAALIVTGVTVALAAIFLLVAYLRLARPRKRRSYGGLPFGVPPTSTPLGAVPPVGPPSPAGPPLNGKTVAGIAAAAAVVGLIIGRRI